MFPRPLRAAILVLALASSIATSEDPDYDGDGDGYSWDVDCNDDDASVHPDAVDPAGDGIDQDCDGFDG